MKYFLLNLFFWSAFTLNAQLTKPQIQQIDSLFLAWNQPNHPGGSVAIRQDGKTIYSKAYGLASLEYLVPNMPNTLYNIASVSKQFTCMGILILAKQGKLSIDEDIRVYLPELPDFGTKITLRHCMHHTSGMRSLHAMLQMAGWRSDDSRNNADLFRFMKQQKELNFQPGSEYLYCNTGYMLMADIIEKITGETFAVWMKSNVFEPLGMTDTYVEDTYNRVVPNNATSYTPNGNGSFNRSIEYWGYVGSGNMHSTTRDLGIWMDNYHQATIGWKTLFKDIQTVDLLTNGDTLYYAFGIDTKTYKEEKRIGHGGAIGGFRSHAASFPAHHLNIIVLTNFSTANAGGKTNKIADIILGKAATIQKDKKTNNAPKALQLALKELQTYVGTYYSPELDVHYHIRLKDDKLVGNHTRHGDFNIKILEKDKLESKLWAFQKIKIIRKSNGNIEGLRVSNGRVRNMWFEKIK